MKNYDFVVREFNSFGHEDFYYISTRDSNSNYLWNDGTINCSTGFSKNREGCWNTKQEAETFLENWIMSSKKSELQAKIEQCNNDVLTLREQRTKLEEELRTLNEPTYRVGDVISDGYSKALIIGVGTGNKVLFINPETNKTWNGFNCDTPVELKNRNKITQKELNDCGFTNHTHR